MKKQYSKPGIFIESFNISQNISVGCKSVPGGTSLGHVNTGSKDSCGWQSGNMSWWLQGNIKCRIPLGENEEIEGVCYNNPSGGNTIFSS